MSNRIIAILILNFIFTSCAVTKGLDNKKVRTAIEAQSSIIENPTFQKILLELENSGNISWPEGSMSYVKEDLSQYKNKTEWLLKKFDSEGIYDKDSVFLWRKWSPFSSTVAVTNACRKTTKLNKWKLTKKRSVSSIVNTLIHERIHSFCYIHPESQKKSDNKCDPSYISGSLAEILHSKSILTKSQKDELCQSLLKILTDYKIVK